ncbi:CD9 antigen-like isoform X2 [Pempheris klunzingeri]|uniref:CD9 antigen-like isoform X2 n=1 Tax=Pempheris klunzingeri TaxID=3127111 RepID=UPI00397FBE0E
MWPLLQICPLHFQPHLCAVTVLIALGSVMLIVVAFGEYGACNEKRSALQVFATLVIILAIAEIAVGVIASSKSDDFALNIGEFYSNMYALYLTNKDPVIGATLTFIHTTLHCCGITGVPVIEYAKNTCPKPDGFMEHIIMPNCPATIITVFDSKAPLVLGIFVGTGALLIIALVCATILAKKTRREQPEISAFYSTVY